MKQTFIRRTKTYQYHRIEWVDRLNTRSKQQEITSIVSHLKRTQKYLSGLGFLHYDYRVKGQSLAIEIQKFIDFVAHTEVMANTPSQGGQPKYEYILLLVQLALFFQENNISIKGKYPAFDNIQVIASIMSELAQKCPPRDPHKSQDRLADLTLIDEKALSPIWKAILAKTLNPTQIEKEWDPLEYIESLATYYMDPPPITPRSNKSSQEPARPWKSKK